MLAIFVSMSLDALVKFVSFVVTIPLSPVSPVTYVLKFVANPLVFCGTVGLLPKNKVDKQVKPGDLVVALGGRTG